jgi:hypothetical protein
MSILVVLLLGIFALAAVIVAVVLIVAEVRRRDG